MITARVRIYPKLDKVAEVRDFMTTWARLAQEQGENLALAQRIYSSEGPVLIVPRRYDDVAAADARRRANLADADWQARLATLSGMLREPIRQTLEESLVGLGAGLGPIGCVRRVFFVPAVDKVAQLRSILTEFVQGRQAEGHGGIALAQTIFSENGPLLIATSVHADIAALDQVRRERAAEAQALVSAVADLCRAPIAVRLLEPIVQFPS
jgi:hypothetical protein